MLRRRGIMTDTGPTDDVAVGKKRTAESEESTHISSEWCIHVHMNK